MSFITIVVAWLLHSMCINGSPPWQKFDISKSPAVLRVVSCSNARVVLHFKDVLSVRTCLIK